MPLNNFMSVKRNTRAYVSMPKRGAYVRNECTVLPLLCRSPLHIYYVYTILKIVPSTKPYQEHNHSIRDAIALTHSASHIHIQIYHTFIVYTACSQLSEYEEKKICFHCDIDM